MMNVLASPSTSISGSFFRAAGAAAQSELPFSSSKLNHAGLSTSVAIPSSTHLSSSPTSQSSLSFSNVKRPAEIYSLQSLRVDALKPASNGSLVEPTDKTTAQDVSSETPGKNIGEANSQSQAKEKVEQQIEAQEREYIAELSARDREVRAHEQAHAAVGGQYAGAPRYDYERGPDGIRYAVGGEVSIDVSKAATPEETLQKAQIIRRAAMAPAEPSAQDRAVAAQASRMEAEAIQALAAQRAEQAQEASEERSVNNSEKDKDLEVIEDTSRSVNSNNATVNGGLSRSQEQGLSVYEQISNLTIYSS